MPRPFRPRRRGARHGLGAVALCGAVLGAVLGAALGGALGAQPGAPRPAVNYDERKVPPYTLPDPLVLADGTPVRDARTWSARRRPELLRLFEAHVYGRSPGRPAGMRFATRAVDTAALGGAAVRKEVRVYLTGAEDGPTMDVLLHLPRARRRAPVPLFLALTYGNHTISADPGIPVSAHWLRDERLRAGDSARATEPAAVARGTMARRWPIERILQRGYGLATVYLGDLEPDHPGGLPFGVRPHFYRPGQTAPAPDDWGALAAWAWGLSRALDYLETDPAVDARRVAVMGHSRTGKAALWAGARDPRFALVVSNESGCGGAALSRRLYGETVEAVNRGFPYWFAGAFRQYNGREAALPVDQHQLLALVAPRPLYVASAEDDRWADPRGEFLAARAASPVYRLLGTNGLPARTMPGVGRPVVGQVGYHVRPGPHDVTAYDWEQFLSFADRHLARRNPAPRRPEALRPRAPSGARLHNSSR